MARRVSVLLCTFAAGAIAGVFATTFISGRAKSVFADEPHKPFYITRIYSGPDGQDHTEQIEVKFAPGKPNDIFKLLPVAGGEIHRATGNGFENWHTTSKRQYLITLRGEGEMEIGGGQKVHLAPGTIDLIEDPTGKGHTTRTTSSEDRIGLHLYLAGQPSQ